MEVGSFSFFSSLSSRFLFLSFFLPSFSALAFFFCFFFRLGPVVCDRLSGEKKKKKNKAVVGGGKENRTDQEWRNWR